MKLRLPKHRAGQAHVRREDWPRVAATVSGDEIVIRELEEGESPHPALQRMVLQAEPCARYRTLGEALAQAAEVLAERVRARTEVPVTVHLLR